LLKKDGVDFQLVFAGKGPDEDAVKQTVRQMDLEDRTVMTGHLQDAQVLDCLYHLATLFVFPSIYDNAPMVLREAAAMRTSALAVKGSCTAEVIEDGINGTLCEDTSEDFCKKVKKFLQMPESERHAIEEQAFETIPIKWDGPIIDKVMERYQNLINLYKFKNRKFE
ncbi:MAG: glycosyltransferase, partial [Spirochaetales bacterium]